MALVERLMRLNDDGSTPSGNPDVEPIAVHVFFAACGQIIAGNLTVANVKNGQASKDEFDTLIGLAPGSNDGAKALFLSHVHEIFILAEVRLPLYSTPAEVRSMVAGL